MKTFIKISVIILATIVMGGCKEQQKKENSDLLIDNGQMPNLASDNTVNFYVTYGVGDSIMYAGSNDEGKTFSSPGLVAVLPGLAASHMRGPQIASTTSGIIILAANKAGDIFSYTEDKTGKWLQTAKVNDVDTVSKEGLMAMGADGQNAFAVWLDLRDKHNKIVGAQSTDGGKTWSKNIMVYASPDTTVCECCKPSVAIKGKNVYVMFRNHLHGNRDLHLIKSSDGGSSFGEAQQLGKENWALNGCPMDGGGLVINNNGDPETVWRRKSTIYACSPGQAALAIGEGKNCTLESVNGKNVYAWTENGEVIILKAPGKKTSLGKGQLPLLKRINNEQVLCVWENNKQIHAQIVTL
jgi:hypothetical protein